MTKRTIASIIALGMMALLGLITIQILWIERASDLQEANRTLELRRDMRAVAHRIEIAELRQAVEEIEYAPRFLGDVLRRNTDSIYNSKTIGEFLRFVNERTGRAYSNVSNVDLVAIFASESLMAGKPDSMLTAPERMQQAFEQKANTQLARDIYTKLQQHRTAFGDRRVTGYSLDTILSEALVDRYPERNYYYQLVADTAELKPRAKMERVLTELYRGEPASAYKSWLVVDLPVSNGQFLRQIFWLLLISAFIILAIGVSFVYMINTILQQKRLSEMRTDFINNMTHEFKTPVATITLASEAMLDPELAATPSIVSRFGRMIYDENQRLKSQVERILNVALLDKPDFELKYVTLNIETLIRKVIAQLELQLGERHARVEYKSYSENNTFQGDEVHITNVIYNLLDNAVKYAKPDVPPEIIVTTQNFEDGITIEIEDNGIGMTSDQARRVFEKFYRVHTGNVHNVKGFGLGLSYVKRIVEKHGGTIRATSQPKIGSKFTFTLPFQKKFTT